MDKIRECIQQLHYLRLVSNADKADFLAQISSHTRSLDIVILIEKILKHRLLSRDNFESIFDALIHHPEPSQLVNTLIQFKNMHQQFDVTDDYQTALLNVLNKSGMWQMLLQIKEIHQDSSALKKYESNEVLKRSLKKLKKHAHDLFSTNETEHCLCLLQSKDFDSMLDALILLKTVDFLPANFRYSLVKSDDPKSVVEAICEYSMLFQGDEAEENLALIVEEIKPSKFASALLLLQSLDISTEHRLLVKKILLNSDNPKLFVDCIKEMYNKLGSFLLDVDNINAIFSVLIQTKKLYKRDIQALFNFFDNGLFTSNKMKHTCINLILSSLAPSEIISALNCLKKENLLTDDHIYILNYADPENMAKALCTVNRSRFKTKLFEFFNSYPLSNLSEEGFEKLKKQLPHYILPKHQSLDSISYTDAIDIEFDLSETKLLIDTLNESNDPASTGLIEEVGVAKLYAFLSKKLVLIKQSIDLLNQLIMDQLIIKKKASYQLNRLSNVIKKKDDINKLMELFKKMRQLHIFSTECKQEQFNHFIDFSSKVGSIDRLHYIINVLTSVYPDTLERFRVCFYTKLNENVSDLIQHYEKILRHPNCFTRYWELITSPICDEDNLQLRHTRAKLLKSLIDSQLFNPENERKVLDASSEVLSPYSYRHRNLEFYRSQRYFDYLVNPHYTNIDKQNVLHVVQDFSTFLEIPERCEFYLNYILDHAFDENMLTSIRVQAYLLRSLTESKIFNPENEQKVLNASANVLQIYYSNIYEARYIKLYRSQRYFDFLLNEQYNLINKKNLSTVMHYFSGCFNTTVRTDFYLDYIVNHADVLLDVEVLNAFSNTPDHLRTPVFINEILNLCSQNTTKQLRIQSICAYINQRVLNRDDNNPIQQINYAQSVHASSVEKSAFESAKRLHELYHGQYVLAHNLHTVKQAILEFINTDDTNSAHSLRNNAAKRYLERIDTTNYYNSFSKLNVEQLLLCCWEGIHDKARRLVSLDDAKQALITGLYEIQRGYNLNEDNVDDGAEDRPICLKGTFIKLVSSLNKIHSAVDIIFITSKQASMKLPAVVKSCLDVYLKEQQNFLSRQHFLALLERLQEDGVKYVENEIKEQVASLMMDEFGSLYNSNDQHIGFVNLLNAFEFVDVSSIIDSYQKRSIESIFAECAAASSSESTGLPIRSLGFFPTQPNKNDDFNNLEISNNEAADDEEEGIQPPGKRLKK